MKEAIRQRARELGFDDCRVTTAQPPESSSRFHEWLNASRHGEMGYLERNADKRGDPQHVLSNARSIITVATSYEIASPQSAVRSRQSGVVARYACFDDYHDVLGERLKTLTGFVNQLGGAETRSLWYVDTGPVLERDFAQRSGLGFVGKHTNVISRKLGNWIFLAEILTTLELEADAPEKNRCGSCARCIAACPTGAITAPFQLDARLCISYLTIELKGLIPVDLRPAIGNRIFGCDDCLAVCPWNRFAREGRLMKSHVRPDLATPDLIELLKLDEAGFKARFAGTPILRAKRRGLLRNVCVALGNVADQTALPALNEVATNNEPLIAEHARWAIQQIKEREHN
jgi:epoxyqueuosine reductase